MKPIRPDSYPENTVNLERLRKPDSVDLAGWRCGCGAPISKAQAGCARWPNCMKKPNSDEREAPCPHGKGWYKSLCAECTPPTVTLGLPLAQRILAALEVAGELQHSFRALAAELRAVIGK